MTQKVLRGRNNWSSIHTVRDMVSALTRLKCKYRRIAGERRKTPRGQGKKGIHFIYSKNAEFAYTETLCFFLIPVFLLVLL